MTDQEKKWLAGYQAAWRRMLGECIGALHAGDELKAEVLLLERTDTVLALRELCELVGDNGWADQDHLGDVIEKHLRAHLDSASIAFIELDKGCWQLLVELLESHELSSLHPDGRAALLAAVRDESRLPENWHLRTGANWQPCRMT